MSDYDYDRLSNFGERYLQYFNADTEAIEIRSRSRNDGSAGIGECMELIEIFLRKHQMTYIPHATDPNLFMFPFMFIEPEEGAKIRNRKTNEVYEVDQIIKNPLTNRWEGLLRLNLVNVPSPSENHLLEFEDPNNYIDYDYAFPDVINSSNLPSANTVGSVEVPPIRPTITWNLVRREPGSMDKPFSSRKELRARLRESVKDPLVPGYTVEIYGQKFDNLVQFDCWSNDFKTSHKLVGWFEQFIDLYRSLLRKSGINQLIFWQRADDNIDNRWRQTFRVRGTQFYIRTEDLHASYERDLLNININAEHASIENRIFKEKRYIADQLVTGELSYDDYRSLFTRSGEHMFVSININE